MNIVYVMAYSIVTVRVHESFDNKWYKYTILAMLPAQSIRHLVQRAANDPIFVTVEVGNIFVDPPVAPRQACKLMKPLPVDDAEIDQLLSVDVREPRVDRSKP